MTISLAKFKEYTNNNNLKSQTFNDFLKQLYGQDYITNIVGDFQNDQGRHNEAKKLQENFDALKNKCAASGFVKFWTEALRVFDSSDRSFNYTHQVLKELAERALYSYENLPNEINQKSLQEALNNDDYACVEGRVGKIQANIEAVFTVDFNSLICGIKSTLLKEVVLGKFNQDVELDKVMYHHRGDAFHVHDVLSLVNVVADSFGIKKTSQYEDQYILDHAHLQSHFEI